MAYDETLAERVRELLADLVDPAEVREQRMFGGVAFMVRGNMCCGVHGSELIARLSPEDGESALGEPFVRPMDMTGRPMRGWLFVGPATDLRRGAARGLAAPLPRPLPSRSSRSSAAHGPALDTSACCEQRPLRCRTGGSGRGAPAGRTARSRAPARRASSEGAAR